jgi:hypothetical protein
MIRVEMRGQEITLHVDDEGVTNLAEAARDANRHGPAKVFLGEPPALLIIRHVDFSGAEKRGDEPVSRPGTGDGR